MAKQYNATSTSTAEVGYTKTDYFLQSLIKSIDSIEVEENQVYINPQERIYLYFSKVNALYSKTHFYISDKFEYDGKKVHVDKLLNEIRNRLYNKSFISDIKKNNIRSDQTTENRLFDEYMNITAKITAIYRHMSYEYSKKGMFFFMKYEETKPGVVA